MHQTRHILTCSVFDLPPPNPCIRAKLCKALGKSKATTACSCWGLRAGKIFRGSTFLLYFWTKKQRRHFFFYYKSAYLVQRFNHVEMAKYQKPPWNTILCQHHTKLHCLLIFYRISHIFINLSEAWAKALDSVRASLSSLNWRFGGEWAAHRGELPNGH